MFKQCLFKYWGSSISHVDKNVIRYTIFSLFIGWWTFGLFFCGFEIVNSTALNREYWYLFETVVSFTLNAYLEVELLDHMVVLFLFFWGISKYLFSWWLCRFAFPTTLVVKWLPANAGGHRSDSWSGRNPWVPFSPHSHQYLSLIFWWWPSW